MESMCKRETVMKTLQSKPNREVRQWGEWMGGPVKRTIEVGILYKEGS